MTILTLEGKDTNYTFTEYTNMQQHHTVLLRGIYGLSLILNDAWSE